jgi:FkbH-like protein
MNNTSTGLADSSVSGDLKSLLLNRDESFWQRLTEQSESARTFNELITLSTLRKKALKVGFNGIFETETQPLKIALVGGSTLFPLSDLIEHLLTVNIGKVELMAGDYNNYRSEILDGSSKLYGFQPDFVIILPDEKSCKYTGRLTDAKELITDEVNRVSSDLLGLCSVVREKIAAEVILCNYILPSYFDLGAVRTKSLASEWNFKKAVNLVLGSRSPHYVHICDLEFLAYRLGGLAAKDEKSWFESKQLCSPGLQVVLAKEIAHLIGSLKKTPKKVLVLDLDNTLWGGVIGDDGIEGIEIGDTSPRGEAFKAFQSYVLSLTDRGLLLGVCSKNDYKNAIEPFHRHPEMVLREEHFVSFKANWKPKAENLIEMASELNLGLDSFIFVDDNPAEIEIVRQFAPEVTTILLDPDPSCYVRQLQESRLFERFSITSEDTQRTEQYRKEAQRKSLLASSIDMDSYLESLEMVGTFKEFNSLDLPRIAQLINKSNQFNLTTKRRTESEIETLMSDPRYVGFSMRLKDRFGDHGLISVIICRVGEDGNFEIDTWLMSCRVLKRQVEEQVLNEIVRLAEEAGCTRVRGLYLPTAKNGMVSDLYPRLGFQSVNVSEECSEYELPIETFNPLPTFISTESRFNFNECYASRSISAAAIHI